MQTKLNVVGYWFLSICFQILVGDLAAEAVFAEAVVVVELDECLRGVGVGAWEVEWCELVDFAIAFGMELVEEVEGFLL